MKRTLPNEDAILALLADGQERTCAQIAYQLGFFVRETYHMLEHSKQVASKHKKPYGRVYARMAQVDRATAS